MPVTSLEATDATRLFELWLEQTIIKDKLSVRVGQLAADEEFILSDGGGYFINGTWGWPSITAADLPSGGPAYPLATPGVRVAVNPNEKMGLLVGVYNGDPAPPCASDDPQRCNDHGLDFELDDDPLLMVEGVYRYNQSGRLPGAVKVGGWNHFGTFEDQRFDSGGALIAVTANSGAPLDHNWGLYAIVDQLIWRVPGSQDPQGVGVFARFIGAPEDRNLIDFYFDGGFTFTGMLKGTAQRCARNRLCLYQHLRPGLGLRRRSRRAGGAQLRGADRSQLHLPGQSRLGDPARFSVHFPARRQRGWPKGRNGRGGAHQYQFLTKDACTHLIPISAVARIGRS